MLRQFRHALRVADHAVFPEHLSKTKINNVGLAFCRHWLFHSYSLEPPVSGTHTHSDGCDDLVGGASL